MNEKSLHLGAKIDVPAVMMNVKRLDADGVARKDEAFPGFLPQRNCKHSPQTPETIHVPAQECLKNHLRIAVSCETVAGGLELRAQFAVVVNLPVQDHH